MLLSRLIIATIALALACTPGRAQTAPGEIKGVDVMGDKTRSANDGWSQAPVPREESAAKDADNPGGTSTAENRNRPVPPSKTDSTAGNEPAEPMDHRTPGPSGQSPAVPSK